MSYIHFSKAQLNNLDFSLEREILQANNTGAYSSSSLVNCNTRKYHGLLVVQQQQLNENRYVLLSAMDETILQGENKIQLGTHQYPDVFYPEGYNYFEDFTYEYCPQWIIKANDVLMKKEVLLVKDGDRILIRYTITESKEPFLIRFDPLLAFRNTHALSISNIEYERKLEKSAYGINLKMYSGFSNLFLQFSMDPEFVQAPDWRYNNEYYQERDRGYDFREDLYCPGYFVLSVKKGDQLIFSGGLTEIIPKQIKKIFESELKKCIPLQSFSSCLENSARQFISTTKKGTKITAGFHWFGSWGRDTFISLPGLTLATGHPDTCKAIIDTMLKNLKAGIFPNTDAENNATYNTADASLWFFWALQKYAAHTGTEMKIWDEYGSEMKSILENYRNGTIHNIHMEENWLIYAGEPGKALTWMDAIVNDKPVTPRIGMTVELNALWYNAICFALDSAVLAEDEEFVGEWESLPFQIELAFKETFWSVEKGYLADYVCGIQKDWSIRPNQIFAASLPYSPVDREMKKSILQLVKEKLLTPRGLRTLSPDDNNYHRNYLGNHCERDLAYHQGTVWPWLLGHFLDAYQDIYGEKALPLLHYYYNSFESTILEYGLGTIAEIYDGDEPHKAKGAISQAWSVAELLRIRNIISAGDKKKVLKSDEEQNN